jgi:hypothetical protein
MKKLRTAAADLGRFCRRLPRTMVWDIFVLGGVALLSIGAGLAYKPLGFVVPGVALLALGILGAWRVG